MTAVLDTTADTAPSAGIPRRWARPRVLVVITLAEVGGAQSYVAGLLPALCEEFDVTVAAHGDGPLREAAEAAGARFVGLRHMRRALSPARDLVGLGELVALIRRERPELVHLNSSKAGVLGRLAALVAGAPVRVFTVHGWAFRAHDGAAARAYLWADRLTAPLTTATVCVAGSELRAGIAARTCRRERTVVLRNGVDLDVPRAAGGASDAPPVVVGVGRLRPPKDFATLVRAVALLPPGIVRARIVGDGPQRDDLAAEIRRLGLTDDVELLGERDDVRALLASADVFVLPTLSEGLPMSVLEAMAAGLPVVASAVGGVPEAVLDGETGVLVAPGRPEALAEAIARLAGEPAGRRRMGEAGRRRAEAEFDLADVRRAHVRLYRSLLAAEVVA
jgi:glycosyltransferase involved in cell wall biosynthesis